MPDTTTPRGLTPLRRRAASIAAECLDHDGAATNCIHGQKAYSCAACVDRPVVGHRVPGTTRTV